MYRSRSTEKSLETNEKYIFEKSIRMRRVPDVRFIDLLRSTHLFNINNINLLWINLLIYYHDHHDHHDHDDDHHHHDQINPAQL